MATNVGSGFVIATQVYLYSAFSRKTQIRTSAMTAS